MSVKEELYHLVGSLDEATAAEALRYLRSLSDHQVQVAAEDADRAAIAASKPFSLDDPLWNIVGLIDDDGPTDVSENKYKYLAEAYGDRDGT
ncbi:MAG: hypothetical protein ACRDJW_05270 [Thermomicrobiales bacterium]